MRPALVGNDDRSTQVLAMNPTRGTAFDAARQLRCESTQWAWIAASTIGAALGVATTWWRHLEIASTLHAKPRRPDTAVLRLFGAVVWTGGAFVLSSGIYLVTLSGASPSNRSDLMRLVAIKGICAASWTPIGVVTASTTI